MNSKTSTRLPNILNSFQTRRDAPVDNSEFKDLIKTYLSFFHSIHVNSVSAIMHNVFVSHLSNICEAFFIEMENANRLGEITLTWWEKNKSHRFVDGKYYLANWKTNYAEIADNWKRVSKDPSNLYRIEDRIKSGIAGLIYAHEYEDIVYATLKYRQETYKRIGNGRSKKFCPKPKDDHQDLIQEIIDRASPFPVTKQINYIGELSGAYILSCAKEQIISDAMSLDLDHLKESYSIEEKCVFYMLKLFIEYSSREIAMRASEMPLKCTKKVKDKKWKFIIEV